MEVVTIFSVMMALVPCLDAAIQPAADSREYFGPDFYRRNSYEVDEKLEKNFMVSPAGIQKFLTLIYQGTEPKQADRMLFDYGVKHIDMQRFRDLVKEETGTTDIGRSPQIRQKLMRELDEPCLKEDVVKYFKNDFKNIGNTLDVKNFIFVPKDLKPKSEFIDFAKNYFNCEILVKNSDDTNEAKDKLKIDDKEMEMATESVELLTKMKMKTRLNDSYTLANGNINAVIEAKYFEDDDEKMQFLDLPLENGLTLFVAIGNEKSDLDYYVTQIVGRRVMDFNNYYKDNWKMEKVLVHLPTIKFEVVNNLVNFFTKPYVREGIKTMLQKDAQMTEAFENWPSSGLKVEGFTQLLEFDLESADNTNAVNGPPVKTFDVIGKTLFFVVKSDKAIYLMGHYQAF